MHYYNDTNTFTSMTIQAYLLVLRYTHMDLYYDTIIYTYFTIHVYALI